MIPRLQTERLILRECRPEDFEAFASFMADRDVMRFIHGEAMSRSDAWRTFAYGIGHWHLRGYGSWAVERKSDGAFMGRVGLVNPEGWPGLEVGWTLGKPYWGQGYATEAAGRLVAFAFDELGAQQLAAAWFHDNPASGRVLAKLGCLPDGTEERACLSRGANVFCHKVVLKRADFERRKDLQ